VDIRERIRVAMEELGSDGCYGVPIDWHWIEISGVRQPHNEHLVGQRIADSAARLGVAPIELYLDTLRDENSARPACSTSATRTTCGHHATPRAHRRQ